VSQPDVGVLVVDDLETFRLVATQVVDETVGFRVVAAVESGEAALTVLRQEPADLVLMDVHMPGMGGVAAAGQIRQLFPRTRVVLLSVHGREDLPAGALCPGCDFCAKELFGPEELERLWAERPRAGQGS
jgi:two-component system, NarL family, invasion response regulator UvrY